MSEFIDCIDFIRKRLNGAIANRNADPDWIDKERLVVALAAQDWARAHGLAYRVTVADVERVEVTAVGHVDYVKKLAIAVAGLLYARTA
jgi:hypothetical protein